MVQTNYTVGILGYGFVGKATAQLDSVARTYIYDPFIEKYASQECKRNAYKADFVIACVPTPESKDGSVDLSILDSTVEEFIKQEGKGTFVIKSTIPSGTTDNYCVKYNTTQIIHNPEFLTERTHMEDFRNPTDIVLGGAKESCEKLTELYEWYYRDLKYSVDINICTAKEAELVKTVRNSFYATKVIFMNEIYKFCETLGIDYSSYEKILTNNGKHPWWGPEHTKVPGPDGQYGVGGKCFPKDMHGLLSLAQDLGVELKVLEAASEQNSKLRLE